MFFIHLKPEVKAGVGGGDRVGISPPPPFLPPWGKGEGREAYPNEFSNITTMKIVNLKPKMRVIVAEEWTAVVTLLPPPPEGRGEVTSSGRV